MTRAISVLVALTVLSFFTGCGSKQFTKGEYDDLSESRMLDDKFNETDMRLVAETMVNSLVGSRIISESKKRPVVMVTLLRNRTQEHIDMKSLTDKVRVALVKSGRFSFTSKEMRGDVAEELEYQGQSGYVDPKTARRKGKQIGANYMLTGEMTDRVQEVGDQKYVYYKCTFNLVNIESGLLDWTDEKEIRKFYKKRRVSF